MPIDPRMVKWDESPQIDPRMVKWDADGSTLDSIKQGAGNLLAGAVRGAGSIGATLLSPIDIAKDAIAGKGLSLESNRARRQSMDDALQTMGAEPDSWMYKGGKLGGEIAGTAGMGGLLAKPVQALAATRYGSGIEPVLNSVATALQTGGFRAGDMAGTGLGNAIRAGAGAAVGGASAGLVNPEDAGFGALVGGALPAVAMGAGKAGDMIRKSMANETTANAAQKFAAAQKGAQSGYVVPPADLQPGIGTELLSGLSGKIKTAQVASQRNQSITDKLVRKELGLAADDVLNADVLQSIRQQAGQAYAPVKQAGMVTADKTYMKALDDIGQTYKGASSAFPGIGKNEVGDMIESLKVGQFDSGGAVDAIKVLREQADKAFRTGDTGLGKATKEAASAIESQLERHLSTPMRGGPPQTGVNLAQKGNFLSASNEFGTVGGTIKSDGLHINYAEVMESARGKGHGRALYQSLIDSAQEKGLRVFSDSAVEKSASNVYGSLAKHGYDVKRLGGGVLEDGAVYGKGGGPAFEIASPLIDRSDALNALREARKMIAKTYSVQKGLNSQTGEVSAQALAKQLEKGKPLSGELRTIAEMGQAFPKAMQSLKEAPKAFSPLDWAVSGGASMASANPLPMAAMLARPAARSYLLSPMAQQAAMRQPGLLASPEEMGLLTQGLYRAAPLLRSD